MTKSPENCPDMDAVRQEIDRIDDDLVTLLVERWGYVDRAWQLKSSVAEATVPWRIQQVIDRVRERAEQGGLPPALVESLWRQLIGWGIQYEEEKLKETGQE
ncbi:MAG: chorismate mutase [Pseudomonadota bacterium]